MKNNHQKELSPDRFQEPCPICAYAFNVKKDKKCRNCKTAFMVFRPITYSDNEITFPKKIQSILSRVKSADAPYEYRLKGVNRYRPGYGLEADIKTLAEWAEGHFASCKAIKYVEHPHNYYAIFRLTDPVSYALEELGI